MGESLRAYTTDVEGKVVGVLPNCEAEALNLEAILGAQVAIGHDYVEIAALLGLSPRELAKQREHLAVDDGVGPAALGRQWAYRLAVLLRTVRTVFGIERCAPLVRLVAHAGGLEVARSFAAFEVTGGEAKLVGAVLREVGELVAKASVAIESGGGIDAREGRALLPQIDDAAEVIGALRGLVVARSTPKRSGVNRKSA